MPFSLYLIPQGSNPSSTKEHSHRSLHISSSAGLLLEDSHLFNKRTLPFTLSISRFASASVCSKFSGNTMPEDKKVIGLSWEPKLPSLSFGTKGGSNNKSQNVSESSLVYKPKSELIDGLFVPPNDPKKVNKLLKKQVKDTTGKNWFDMPAPTLTSELKKDLKLLKLRNVIDPKRHYKKGDSKLNTFPKYFQVGTVVEPISEYFTSRLTKKERKPTLADELLSDQSLKVYRKRKVREIEEKNQPGGFDKWKIKGKSSWKRAKQRRH